MRLSVLMGILFALVAFSPVPAEAAVAVFAFDAKAEHKDGAKGEHKTGEHKAGEHKAEPLNPFKGSIDLLVFTALLFLALYAILNKLAWPQIQAGLEKRERSIAAAKQEAEHARKEAAEMRHKLEAELAKVNEEIRQLLDRARQEAQSAAAEELARGKAELTAERDRLQQELRASTEDAQGKLWEQAAQLATLISSKAVRKQLRGDDHQRLLAEALNEFGPAARDRTKNLQETRA